MTTVDTSRPQTGRTSRPDLGSIAVRWVPGLAAYAVIVLLLALTGVRPLETVHYTGYVALGLTLPGLVLWRMLDLDPASLLEDLVLGTGLSYAVGLACYFAVAAAGAPGLIVLWPLLPLLASLHPRLRRRVWRRAPTSLPAWFSAACAGFVALIALVLCQGAWTEEAVSGSGLRTLYVDLPYHLSLITGLARGVPSDLPFLRGEPLYYHWFVHAQIAAETHMTGLEPTVLLFRLSLLPMVVVMVIGSALVARRLAGSAGCALVAPLVLVVGQSAFIWPGSAEASVRRLMYLSPTMTFADVLLVVFAALATRLLRPGPVPGAIWPALVVVIAALSGAKGPALPVLVGGWLTVIAVHLLATRRPHWRAVIGLAVTVVALAVAQVLVYGGSSQGAVVRPFGTGALFAENYQVVPSIADAGLLLSAAAGVVLVLVTLTAGVGLVPLTIRRWRDPRAVLLAGWVLAGVVALMTFYADARNQYYFLYITPVAMAIGSAWGVSLLWRRVAPRQAAVTVGVAAVLGFVLGVVSRGRSLGLDRNGTSFTDLLVQPGVVAVVASGLAAALLALGRRRRLWRATAPLAVTALLVGICLPAGTFSIIGSLAHPDEELRPRASPWVNSIGQGGITAARWLRAHSASDAVVATNVHCRVALPAGVPCDRRVTWVSAFSERQVLIEGWAYTSQSAQRAEAAGTSVLRVPFWHPRLLAANDAAIAAPTAAGLALLHKRYDVDWLFVDKRFPYDLPGLRRLADVQYDAPHYAVVRIR